MKCNTLQNIVFPYMDRKDVTDLYFRLSKQAVISNNGIILKQNSSLNTLTYFNSFSVEKWARYTVVNRFFMEFLFLGTAVISVMNTYIENGELIIKTISSDEYSCDGINPICIPFVMDGFKGLLGYEVMAVTGVTFISGRYFTECEPLCDIALAINICTRNRQEYLLNNVKKLLKLSEYLPNGLEIFISNNGTYIELGELENKSVHIFNQPGFGSSGGFSRGAYEIISSMRDRITHVIFMDDDVCIEKESIFRTWSLLSYAYPEYSDNILGGALLRMDIRYIQHESGASWNNGYIKSINHNFDLRNIKDITLNELETQSDYFGWWFCCIPVMMLINKGLSLPIYFHREDVEYGLRNPSNTCLNGICVWHEPFENKPFSVNKYYDTRNTGVVNSIYIKKFGTVNYIKYVFRQTVYEIFRYRYLDALLILKGAEDFCHGPEWMISNDSNEMYEELKRRGYLYICGIPPENIIKYNTIETSKHRFWRLFTLNGYLLPASGQITIPAGYMDKAAFFRVKKVFFYSESLGSFYTVERSWLKTIQVFLKMISVFIKIFTRYHIVSKMWRSNIEKYTSITFWKEYFYSRKEKSE